MVPYDEGPKLVVGVVAYGNVQSFRYEDVLVC